ncbi:hypothetical protein MUN81_11210 [Hymenobacter sp. 5317J-9]|uniref:hypothetical protein n=1 Tax=Hymenobacter sp. 5317J-9 TaxID=2932250 RepID=UPI001FD6AB25|nr:hypothetical protein [Hymenobacter sp. 5317J-9]UOQ95833.1 hypothetical protein MUN81_11210 [Hymenobacter sp. 5317J-9]
MKIFTPPPSLTKKLLLLVCCTMARFAAGQALQPDNFCGTETAYNEEELRQLPWADNNQYLVDYLREHAIDVPADYIDQIKAASDDPSQGYAPRTLTQDEVYRKDAEGRMSSPGMLYVPIKAWIHQRSDGSGGRSLDQVRDDIAQLNAEFARSNVPITFYLKCGAGYIPDSYLYDRPDAGALDYMWRTWFDASAVNVHFVNEPGTSSSINGGTWAGIARLPKPIFPRFLLTLSNFASARTFAHEMGHVLGLPHTHNARDQNNSVLYNGQSGDCYQESSSRTRTQGIACVSTWGEKKAEVNGDALMDTPGDPVLSDSRGSYYGFNTATGRYEYTGGLNDRFNGEQQAVKHIELR